MFEPGFGVLMLWFVVGWVLIVCCLGLCFERVLLVVSFVFCCAARWFVLRVTVV